MLIPRFSTLGLFGLVTAGALVALTVRYAFLQHHWAIAVVIGFAFLLLVFLLHGLAFLYTWFWTQVYRTVSPAEELASPFAENAFPTQVIRPPDPE